MSNLLFLGFQLDGIATNKSKRLNKIALSNLIVYNTIFYTLIDNILTFGLEIRTHLDLATDQSFIAFYPQLDFNLSQYFELQMGLGLFFTKDKFIPQFVHRVTLAKPAPTQSP
jgi:hypothetical protein